jgi:Flp pilus assembly protein TadB
MSDEPIEGELLSPRDDAGRRPKTPVAREPAAGNRGRDARPKVATWQYSYSGRASGPSGFVAAALVLAAIVVALVVGAVAVTMMLWIGLVVLVVGVFVAVVRRVFGLGGASDRRSGGGPSAR